MNVTHEGQCPSISRRSSGSHHSSDAHVYKRFVSMVNRVRHRHGWFISRVKWIIFIVFLYMTVTLLLTIGVGVNSSIDDSKFIYAQSKSPKILGSEQINLRHWEDSLNGEDRKILEEHFRTKPEKTEDTFCGHEDTLDLDFQIVETNIFLFSAFWDSRPNDFNNKFNKTFIRMIGTATADAATNTKLVCTFQKGSEEYESTASVYSVVEDHKKPFSGFIFSCSVPSIVKSMPCTISVKVQDSHTSSLVILPVHDTEPAEAMHDFSVCVPPLFEPLNSQKLIEFVELTRLLGADHFTFYANNPSKDIGRVLNFYKKLGVADIVHWKLPMPVRQNIWYKGQTVALQDCLYRNMASSYYVAFTDLDEFIIPLKWNSWSDYVRDNMDQSKPHLGFAFESVVLGNELGHENSIPRSPLMTLNFNMRSQRSNGIHTKNIVNPVLVFEKGIHHVSKAIDSSLNVVKVPPTDVVIYHFSTCRTMSAICQEKIVSNRIFDLFGQLLPRYVSFVIEKMKSKQNEKLAVENNNRFIPVFGHRDID